MAAPTGSFVAENSLYEINQGLYEAATAIKEKMKITQHRLEKMKSHQQEVSESVYLKVKTDYEAQLEDIEAAFKEKCKEIQQELRSLYQAEAMQKGELSKHQEILEEGKFRHTLGEYNEKKFKELEEQQSREIQQFTGLLEKIQKIIRQYQEVIGSALAGESKPPPVITKSAVSPAAASAARPIQTDKTPVHEAATPRPGPPAKHAPLPQETVVAPLQPGSHEPAESQDELDLFLESEGDYFTHEEDFPASTRSVAFSAQKTSAPAKHEERAGTDDSISGILKDLPFEDESSISATPPLHEEISAQSHATADASLILIQGQLENHEFVLGENTSIGRSTSNDIVLKESKVSRQHAAINRIDGKYVLIDLKSANGVWVQGEKVEEATLKDGDEISIGSFKFRFQFL